MFDYATSMYELWHDKKSKIQKEGKRPYFKEREVWYVNLGKNVGYEQNGKGDDFLRPMVILKKFNKQICWAIPLSTAEKEGCFYVPTVVGGKKGVAILSQLRLVDVKRLSYRVGFLDTKTFKDIKIKSLNFLQEKGSIVTSREAGVGPKAFSGSSIDRDSGSVKKYEVLEFPYFEDDRGSLVPMEIGEQIPFEVKRVYLVTAKEGQTRGGHAHIVEDEVFVAVSGSMTALVNDGNGDKEIVLDSKTKGLYVQKDCWHEFYNFSENAVMLCFSSTHYLPGEENYIMDKEVFLAKA